MYRLLNSEVGQRAAADMDLAKDCARHARLFFNSADLDLASAYSGTFALRPLPEMEVQLRHDYAAMQGMIFGSVPDWEEIMAEISRFEVAINALQR